MDDQEVVAGAVACVGASSGVEGPRVRLDDHPPWPAHEIGMDGPAPEVDRSLGLDCESHLDRQGPQHRLEGVRRTSVGVPEHASYGCGPGPTHVDPVELRPGDQARAQGGVGDGERLVERQDPTQSSTVRSGVVTPRSTWSGATFAQCTDTPSRRSAGRLRPRRTMTSGTGGCTFISQPWWAAALLRQTTADRSAAARVASPAVGRQ